MSVVYELDEDKTSDDLSECLLVVKPGINEMHKIRLYFSDHPSVEINPVMYNRAYLKGENLHIHVDDGNIEVLPSTEDTNYIVVHYDLGEGPKETMLWMPYINGSLFE
jgi:hypothetical protein